MRSSLVSQFSLIFYFDIISTGGSSLAVVGWWWSQRPILCCMAWRGGGGPGQHDCFLLHNNHCAARPRIGNLWEGERKIIINKGEEKSYVWDAPFYFSGALSLSVSHLSRMKKSEWLSFKYIYLDLWQLIIILSINKDKKFIQ